MQLKLIDTEIGKAFLNQMKVLPTSNFQSEASTNLLDRNTRSESNIVVNTSHLSEGEPRRYQAFAFGSKILAIIYMANTMVIPDMNQVVDEIVFDSPQWMIFSIVQYLAVLIILVVPSYLMIQQCKRENSPFYHQIIDKYTTNLSRKFIYANMGINVIALFNLVIKLMDYGMRSIPNLSDKFQESVKGDNTKNFLIVWFLYFLVGVTIHFILRHLSYFENFNKIQWRLVMTFVSKWLIFMIIFMIIFAKQICLDMPKPQIQKFTLHIGGIAQYYVNIFYCLSFPFVEVYFIKRETNTHVESPYKNTCDVFKAQFFLRSTFFLLQLVGWGLLYQLHQNDTLSCFQSPEIQILMFSIMILMIITVAPIFANNFAHNRLVLKRELMGHNADRHRQYIFEAYNLSALILFIIFAATMVLRFLIQNSWEIKLCMVRITQSLQAVLFGLSCMIMPIYIEYHRSCNPIKRKLLMLIIFILFVLFTMIFVAPWVGLVRTIIGNCSQITE